MGYQLYSISFFCITLKYRFFFLLYVENYIKELSIKKNAFRIKHLHSNFITSQEENDVSP